MEIYVLKGRVKYLMNDIKVFSQSAINIIIKDILKVSIITPSIVFDYSTNPNIRQGYYMYKNINGTIITLNMNAIEALKDPNDMKTVITYGFIHEILHMFQYIKSDYFNDNNYYMKIEDSTDYDTIKIIRENLDLINTLLKFEFNEVFLIGIERQLHYRSDNQCFNYHDYTCNIIAGALCSKMNINYDYIRSILTKCDILKIIFIDKSEYSINMNYCSKNELNSLMNLIHMEDIKFMHIDFDMDDNGFLTLLIKLF